MNNILYILDDLASSNSRLHKEAVIRSQKDNELFKYVLFVAMNPKINFFMKVPKATRSLTSDPTLMDDGEPSMSLSDAIDFAVDKFSTREISGNAAKQAFKQIYEKDLNADDAEVFRRIIDKDLRIGCTENTVNKILGKEFIYVHPNLLCEPISDKLVRAIFEKGKGAILQLKSDGGRVNIYVYPHGAVSVFSRSGNPLSVGGRFDWLGREDLGFRGTVIDGEVLQRSSTEVGGVASRQVSNGILNKLVHGTASDAELDRMVIHAWDQVPLENFLEKKKYEVGYERRFENLKMALGFAHCALDGYINVEPIESHFVNTYAEAVTLYKKYIAMGLEGAILKDLDLPWEDDRSKLALKMKKIQTCELRVVAIEKGELGGRNEHRLGGLICESECGQLKTKIGKGYTDQQREEFMEGMIGKIIEVEYNSVTKARDAEHYSLFLESFIQIRIDKTRANTLEEIAK